jgi:subtilisin family serine protease
MTHSSTWITPKEAAAALANGRGRGIKIAVLDSGIELSHPELHHLRLIDDLAYELNAEGVPKRIAGRGIDLYGHGTAVASVIHRAAPEAQIGSFRVLDDKLGGKRPLIQEAALTAIDRGYHILNCSFGSEARLDTIGFFKSWVDYAYRQGVHVVSACNNSYFRNPEWPGYFPSVVTVNMANTESDDLFFRWDLSFGSEARHLVEFAARGVDLKIPWKGNRIAKHSGSSFAAPHVAGLLSRLLSVYPNVKPLVAKSLLQEVAKGWTAELIAPNS